MSFQSPKLLVSVIMPVKNGYSCFLKESIKSVLDQTLTQLELLLIVDDDPQYLDEQLLEILKEFKNDDRLRIVTNRKKGFVEALNTGIEVAHGKYIARMDSDDISFRNRLELQVETMEKNGLDLVGGWAYVIDEQGKTVGKLTPPTNSKQIRKMIMVHNPFLHSSVIFKKSILKKTGLYNFALFGAEDYELWLRIVSLGYKCANIPDFVLYLRETQDSIVRGNTWRRTRVNYTKAKMLGLVKWGYHDPLSITSCFASPFSSLMKPKTALQMKSLLKWFEYA